MNKLLNNIQSSFNGITEILSVSVDLNAQQNSVQYSLYKLSKNKFNKIDFPEKELEEAYSKKAIALTITGKGVLNKFTPTPMNKVKLRNIIPNIKEEDFYVNLIPNKKGTWVCLIRKDLLHQTLTELKINIKSLCDLHIGTAHLQCILNQNESLPSNFKNLTFKIEDKQLIAIEQRDESITNSEKIILFGEKIPINHLLIFAAGIIGFTKLNIDFKASIWVLNQNELRSKKGFYNTVKIALGFLLIVFLSNMIAFQMLNSKYNELNNDFNQYSALTNEANKLIEIVDSKKRFVDELGLLKNPHFAALANELGASVPKKIQLQNLTINPIQKSIRKNKFIEFNTGVFSVKGFCNSTQICNQWVEILRGFEWAKKVELNQYFIDKNKVGNFEIEIEF